MNIFFVSADPIVAAQSLHDRHVVKMILETGQLLSSAHRLLHAKPVKYQVPEPFASQLRGQGYTRSLIKQGALFPVERLKFKIIPPNEKDPARLEWEYENQVCCALTHQNHPCSIWTRASAQNYQWLFRHFVALNDEKVHRYGRPHATFTRFAKLLSHTPAGIAPSGFTSPAQAMPDEFKAADPVLAYRAYYRAKKQTFGSKNTPSKWTNRQKPSWL